MTSEERIAEILKDTPTPQHPKDAGEVLMKGSVSGTLIKPSTIDSTHVKDASLLDGDLAAPNNATYKTVFSSQGMLDGGAGAGTYYLGSKVNPLAPSNMNNSGGTFKVANDSLSPDLWILDDADFDVANKVEYLRIRCGVMANATAPFAAANTIKFSLRAVVPSGAVAKEIVLTSSGTANGEVTVSSPGANGPTTVTGSDFALPADGVYALVAVTSAALQANTEVICFAEVQVRSLDS